MKAIKEACALPNEFTPVLKTVHTYSFIRKQTFDAIGRRNVENSVLIVWYLVTLSIMIPLSHEYVQEKINVFMRNVIRREVSLVCYRVG
jgi:hypothetical protein